MNDLHQLARNCEHEILKRQLPEGGWGFENSRQWVTETTALALLALRFQPSTVCARGLEFLVRCQNPNGSWPGFAGDDAEGSWVTALAVIAVIHLNGDWNAVEKGISWLLETQGRESHWLMKWRYRTVDRKVQFDPDKYGWPWTVGASSWVVPTAYSLMALRQSFTCCLPEAADLRLKKGTAMLFDRACPAGGWNAGNGVVYGVLLNPHADVTSLALLALLPEKNHPLVQKSLNWLHTQWERMPSIYGLSWLAMALAAYQRSVEPIIKRIVHLYNQHGMNQDCQTLALTRIAVQVTDRANPFR
jgi:Prenyltransferase and squalene oxidase repeat